MSFDLKIDGLRVCDVLSATVSEGFNQHSRLTAVVRFDQGQAEVLGGLGKTAEVVAKVQGQEIKVFAGPVTRLRRIESRRQYAVEAAGTSFRMDIATRRRTFAASSAQWTPIHDLPGFRDAFKGVEGLDVLDGPVLSLTQWDETDWELLVRAAALSGGSVIETSQGISIARKPEQTSIVLSDDDLIDDSSTIDLRVGCGEAEALTWDLRNGIVPAAPSVSSPLSTGSAISDRPARAASEIAPEAREQCFDQLPATVADLDRAALLAAMGNARLFVWQGATRRCDVGCGDRIELPAHVGIDGSLLVLERRLEFCAARRSDQMRSEILCVPGDRAVPDRAALRPRPPIIAHGQVAEIAGRGALPMVRVNFPWQKRVGAPGGWEGIWCEVPQDFTGRQETPHGALRLPARLDWVRVLLDPFGAVPPIVLGAVGHESNRLPPPHFDPSGDRVILLTEQGQFLASLAKPARLVLALLRNGDPAQARASIALEVDEADGPRIVVSVPEGGLLLRGKHVTVEASDEMTVRTPSFNVEGVKP